MIRRETPKDKSKYIMINNDNIIYTLAKDNVFPIYMDNEYSYFIKSEELEKYLLERGDGIIGELKAIFDR